MKATVQSLKRVANDKGEITQEEIGLQAVYGEQGVNKLWCKWTPHINFSFTVRNPEAFGKLLPGQFVFIDITPTTIDG
jgi:hypothetical protein